MSDQSFPTAETSTKSAKNLAIAGISRMWIATIACLIVAIGLTWYSLGDSGTEIVLHFQQGYGLKPGDTVRYRGIEIGTVSSVQLNGKLTGIEVCAELSPGAEGVAREGSRFWIVRPQLDVTGIRGLETAVGGKYIAVAPGPIVSPIRQLEFTGLESPPVDQLGDGGLELVLRGEQRFGVNPGSPLTWRGIEVGQVLSSGLSPDAMHVDTRVRIDANHQRLVGKNSKFWVTSGVHVDFGVSGVEVTAESLATIARGGIAFITPAGGGGGDEVQAGDVFTLHEDEDESWTELAAAIDLLELHPPNMISLDARWQEKLLGFTRMKRRRTLGVAVQENGNSAVIVPTDFLHAPKDAVENTFAIQFNAHGKEASKELDVDPITEGETLTKLRLGDAAIAAVGRDRFRVPTDPEDCFVVRQQSSESGVDFVIEAIGKHELTVDGSTWRTTKSGLSPDVWHGAAVLAAADEQIIGLLLINDDHIRVAPLTLSNLPN